MMISFIIAALIIAADRAVKMLTASYIPLYADRAFIPGVLDFTHTTNDGAAFGLMSGYMPLFIAVTIAAVSVMVYLIIAKKFTGRLWTISIGFVLGGAAGNLIDRIISGKVIDTFRFLFIDFPIFNVADIFVTSGCIMLIIYLLADVIRESRRPHLDGK